LLNEGNEDEDDQEEADAQHGETLQSFSRTLSHVGEAYAEFILQLNTSMPAGLQNVI
jgi:uncharacterized damage-inducible protein DinB